MPMTEKTFYAMVGAFFARALQVMQTKGADYAHDENKLANFERQAVSMSLDPLVIIRVYQQKHLDAIDAYIKEGKLESEPLEMRIIDGFINYGLLLFAQAVANGYEPQESWLREAFGKALTEDLGIEVVVPPAESKVVEITTGKKVVQGSGHGNVAACCSEGEDCCEE